MSFEKTIRFLFSWPDRVLNEDWRSTYEPIGLGTAERDEDMRQITRRYLAMRRNAEGWNPRRLDRNSHRAIVKADVSALLADARRLDVGDRNGASGKRRPGRPSKADGRLTRCAVCGGVFRARRATARYCAGACRQKALRGRLEGQIRDANARETHAVSGLAAHSPTEGSPSVLSVTDVTGERHG